MTHLHRTPPRTWNEEERDAWYRRPEWSATSAAPHVPPPPPELRRNGIDEALRELSYRARNRDPRLYNPFARRS